MKNSINFGIKGLLLFVALSFVSSCGSNYSDSHEDENTTLSSEDKTDYGKVSFKTIYLYADAYGNNFDEVPVRPSFTNPEACVNEIFEYEISNEDICYIENNCVYATGVNGSTRVIAKSQHLRGSFYVYSESKFNNANAFSSAKSLASTASKVTNQGTTLFVGASFWEFWRNKTNINESFDEAFAGYDVANVGIAGTQAREWRSLRKKLIDPYKPTNIVLNLGNNDINDNSEDGEAASEYLMTLCNDIWAHHPNCQIYYCSITRCAGVFARNREKHEETNRIMKANAENNEKLHYLDIMEKYGDKYADYEQSDGMHPNSDGYAIYKEVIKANVPLKAK